MEDFSKEASQLLLVMARSLVDDPSSVDIVASSGSHQTVLFCLKCTREDLGKLIGRSGRTASAMRQILGAVAAKHNKRAVLDIEE